MKLSNFRIKDKLALKSNLNHQKQAQLQENHENLLHQQKFSSFFQSFQNLINNLIQNHTKSEIKEQPKPQQPKQPRTHNLDYRDRYVMVQLPQFQGKKIELPKLQEWVGEVCSETLSVSFHYFTENKMNYEQMKAFASESVLRNLSVLMDTFEITASEIEFIDKIMNKSVFPYLKAKYPLTVENTVNKALQNVLQEIDNTEILANDYLFNSDVRFQYRQSGRYDDLIMRLINEILMKVDMKVGQEEGRDLSLYKDFQNTMADIFQKSYDELWMSSKNNMKQSKTHLSQKEKQKYREKVSQYTHFLIGRKVSQNTELYSQQQIKSGYLSVKSPNVLRILTKWCEELWQKYQNENYFNERTDGLGLISHKKVGLVFPWLKTLLKQKINKEKKEIDDFFVEIQKKNYLQQSELLKSQLQNTDSNYIEKYQKVVGKFACKVFNNIQHFIVKYLNRLIHGLLNVSRVCYLQMKQFSQYWPSPYNLLSFKIGDLIRCKYSSKQKQVLRIFEEIEKLSRENEEKFKIIRIKNRLRKGTKDILINAIFNNTIKCQIQLAVNSTTSDFIVCSNYINHYIYELERSRFGPLSQICSIWKNYDNRSNEFDKLILKQKPKRRQKVLEQSQCQKFKKQHKTIVHKGPFICSQCSKHQYHNNYVVNHLKCKNCEYFKCASCLIKENVTAQNKDFFLKQHQFKDMSKFWKNVNQVPQAGICIFLKRNKIEPIVFKKVAYNFKTYLVRKLDGEVVIMKEISSQKDLIQFSRETITFEIPQSTVRQYFGILNKSFEENLVVKLFIPQYIKNCLKQQKQTISILRQDHLTKVNFEPIISQYKEKLKTIKNIQYSSTLLKNLDIIFPEFTNLRRLNINLNQVEDVSKITAFTKLQKLYMNENKIQKLPDDIEKLTELKQLDAYNNQIYKIPPGIVKIKSLNVINLNTNIIQQIPQYFESFENLKILMLKKNEITIFPQSLTRNKKLEIINLEQNRIRTMPEQFQDLCNLNELYLNQNYITNLPKKMQKCRKLTVFEAKQNTISQIQQCILFLPNLQQLNLSNNKITQIPQQISNLQSLKKLDLDENILTKLPQGLFKLEKLDHLSVNKNKIIQTPDSFDKLKNLSLLDIEENQITIFPRSILKNPPKSLFVYRNPYESIPYEMLTRSADKVYFDQSNMQRIKCVEQKQPPAYRSEIKLLQMRNMALQKFPEFLVNFQNLQHLNLQTNCLSEIPEIFTQGMKINKIELKTNNLTALPISISKLKFLEKLDLSKNKLTDIPQQYQSLISLIHFNIEKNQFNTVPSAIGKMIGLKFLFLGKNEIEEIPDFVGKLPNLQELDGSQNKIKAIPLTLCTNNKITRLYLQKNIIEIIPAQINQMTSLNDKCLMLDGNPLKQLGDKEFLLKKVDYRTLQMECFRAINNQNRIVI